MIKWRVLNSISSWTNSIRLHLLKSLKWRSKELKFLRLLLQLDGHSCIIITSWPRSLILIIDLSPQTCIDFTISFVNEFIIIWTHCLWEKGRWPILSTSLLCRIVFAWTQFRGLFLCKTRFCALVPWNTTRMLDLWDFVSSWPNYWWFLVL